MAVIKMDTISVDSLLTSLDRYAIEYSNYIESKKRMENQLPILEQNVIQNNMINSIVANEQATRENDYARKNGMTMFDVLPGMNIEDVAKEICGKRYMCKFNDFEIDGTKYASAEEIVEAYDKHYKEIREQCNKLKEQQLNDMLDDNTKQNGSLDMNPKDHDYYRM